MIFNNNKVCYKRNIKGNKNKPRISIFKSNKYLYVQIIDDERGHTLYGISSQNIDYSNKTSKKEVAKKLAYLISLKLKNLNINKITFDIKKKYINGSIKILIDTLNYNIKNKDV